MNNLRQVCVIGLGYIGLPTAALIASKNIKVIGVDINQEIVQTINAGKIHIIEPDLEGLVKYDIEHNWLLAKTQPEKSDVFLIAVPTPFRENHQPDITYIQNAVESLLPILEQNNLVILESTSPVGTTEKIADFIFNNRPDLKDNLYIAYCPERVLPGQVLFELEHNDRVLGGINSLSTEKVKSFYRLFVKGELHITNARTAEMCKLVENSYRDVNIAFANELSMLSDEANIDVRELIQLANKHPRVNILNPGPGVGGHCIAVDPWFLVTQFPANTKMIRNAREVNEYKTIWVIQKIEQLVLDYKMKNKKEPTIGLLGLSYKSDIDDLRESPALFIAETLNKKYTIVVNEPNVQLKSIKTMENIEIETLLSTTQIVIKLVNHKIYDDYNFEDEKFLFKDFS